MKKLWQVPVIVKKGNEPSYKAYLIEIANSAEEAINNVKKICKKVHKNIFYTLDLFEWVYNENGREVQLFEIKKARERAKQKKFS